MMLSLYLQFRMQHEQNFDTERLKKASCDKTPKRYYADIAADAQEHRSFSTFDSEAVPLTGGVVLQAFVQSGPCAPWRVQIEFSYWVL